MSVENMSEVEFCQHMVGQIRTAIANQSGYNSAELSTAGGGASKYTNWEPSKLRHELDVWEQKLRDAQAKESGNLSPRITVLVYEQG